jgi:hypothetical protein
VPFLRVTRDQRGYETTFLLHAAHPGGRPRVLYWYRTAPGIRVGRLPLDEDAIRAIEDRYPDLEFDWPSLIEQSTMLPPEVERRPERPHRKPPRAATVETSQPAPPPETERGTELDEDGTIDAEPPPSSPSPRRSLLDELVGREIAARLRSRYAELQSLIARAGGGHQEKWNSRVAALDPDSWQSPEEILHGVEHAEARFEELRRELG